MTKQDAVTKLSRWLPTIIQITVIAGGMYTGYIYVQTDVTTLKKDLAKVEKVNDDQQKRIEAIENAVTDIKATIREGFQSIRQSLDGVTRQVGRLEDRLSTTASELNKSIVHVNNRLDAVRWLKTNKENQQ